MGRRLHTGERHPQMEAFYPRCSLGRVELGRPDTKPTSTAGLAPRRLGRYPRVNCPIKFTSVLLTVASSIKHLIGSNHLELTKWLYFVPSGALIWRGCRLSWAVDPGTNARSGESSENPSMIIRLSQLNNRRRDEVTVAT